MKKKSFEKPELSVEDLSHALYEANLKLTKTIEERDEIFANISHDLRSPITAIRSSVEYIQSLDHPTEDDLNSAIKLIDTRSQVLQKMVNDIFLLTKIDSSSYNLNFVSVPAIPFLEDTFYTYDAEPEFSQRELILDVNSDLSGSINIDIENIKRVLDNLFNNALKFTGPDDKIILSAGLNSDNDKILITVSDTGIGIEKDKLPLVFNRTYRISDARTPNNNPGAGLGLSICRSIIEKHNGSIWCTSEGKGHGTSFTFELNYEK
ncbi:MAG: HAMP domain-containing histidine kinase [Butyrivibrio sp.]|nr:HAMP domain-containing histidine kinase [Butyrivibrio sp.]